MKKLTQEQRVHLAMLKGESIDWKWGIKQRPYIADATRRCRRLREKDFPVKTRTVKTKNSSYMQYYYDIKSMKS